jgi:HTH-type transcriptional regulator, competence development regulator
METFSNIIKKAREKKKLLIRQAAAMLDIDPSLLSKYEKGDRRPTRELIEKMSIIYELDKNEILTEWLSDKIVYETQEEDFALNALKIAEKKIKYITKNKKK